MWDFKLKLDTITLGDIIFPPIEVFILIAAVFLGLVLGIGLMWYVVIYKYRLMELRGSRYQWGQRKWDHVFFLYYLEQHPDFDTAKNCGLVKCHDKDGKLFFRPVRHPHRYYIRKEDKNVEGTDQ